MKNLTQKQIKQLETVRANLSRAVAYMKQSKIAGVAEAIDPKWANGGDYLIKNPAVCESSAFSPPVIGLRNKQIGSDIAGMYTALHLLNEFLEIEE